MDPNENNKNSNNSLNSINSTSTSNKTQNPNSEKMFAEFLEKNLSKWA